jgi:flagellar basal-body rod modification protein FlgD
MFQLQQPAEQVTVTIRDAAGNTIRTLALGAVQPGSREVVWDGQSDAGQRVQPGLYRMEISARGAGDVPIAATTQVSGVVDAISYEGGFPELVIAGQHVMLGDVQEVSAAR